MKKLVLVLALAIALYGADTKRDWREGTVRAALRYASNQANPTVNIGQQSPLSVLTNSVANRARHKWAYAIDAGSQVYFVESKASLDVDIDQPTKFATSNGDLYLMDRIGKEHKTKIVSQMSRAELDQMDK